MKRHDRQSFTMSRWRRAAVDRWPGSPAGARLRRGRRRSLRPGRTERYAAALYRHPQPPPPAVCVSARSGTFRCHT